MEPSDEFGESAFLSRRMKAQQEEHLEIEPPQKRKRRWVLRFMVLSALGAAVGGGILTSMDEGLRKTQANLRRLFPNFFDQDEPVPAFGVQKGKLKNEDAYRAFIDSLELQYISADELIQPHRNIHNGVKNELPPKRYWSRIEETLKVADAIRKELGVPLQVINSAYRSHDYNKQCGGASKSYHTQNRALDLVYACPAKDAAQAAKKLREKGVFSGGIGVYPNFIHIDTRGRNANWGLPT